MAKQFKNHISERSRCVNHPDSQMGSSNVTYLFQSPENAGISAQNFSPRFSIEAKRSLYLRLVRSNLGYASEVWSALSGKNLRMVEGIQRRATKFFSDTTTLINLTKTDYKH
jgi:hypothetical protein